MGNLVRVTPEVMELFLKVKRGIQDDIITFEKESVSYRHGGSTFFMSASDSDFEVYVDRSYNSEMVNVTRGYTSVNSARSKLSKMITVLKNGKGLEPVGV